jgi:predicted metal-binding membrane protein
MTSPGGDLGGLGWFVAFWAAMTAAMMLPASAPVLIRLARAWRTKAIAFVAGYGAVWMAAGLLAWALIEGVRGLHPGLLAWSNAGRYLAGAAVAAAGLFQLSRAKRRWLERCTAAGIDSRPPASIRIALRAGVDHGGCCLACCWPLMAALYALGMMSFTWMALITVLIVGERWVPRPGRAVRAAAVVLVVLALGVAAAPSVVPGLTVPSSRMMAMGSMSR